MERFLAPLISCRQRHGASNLRAVEAGRARVHGRILHRDCTAAVLSGTGIRPLLLSSTRMTLPGTMSAEQRMATFLLNLPERLRMRAYSLATLTDGEHRRSCQPALTQIAQGAIGIRQRISRRFDREARLGCNAHEAEPVIARQIRDRHHAPLAP